MSNRQLDKHYVSINGNGALEERSARLDKQRPNILRPNTARYPIARAIVAPGLAKDVEAVNQ
jgi:hypothetical protein